MSKSKTTPAASCLQLIRESQSLQLATLGYPQSGPEESVDADVSVAVQLDTLRPHIGYTPYLASPEHVPAISPGLSSARISASEAGDSRVGDSKVGGGQSINDGRRCFYIFVSELALHTRDLLRLPQVSIMIVEDESSTQQIFARRRVYYECEAELMDTQSEAGTQVLDLYRQRHGKMVDVLRTLPDFKLFRLQPVSGQFVMGFGQAFRLSGPELSQFERSTRA